MILNSFHKGLQASKAHFLPLEYRRGERKGKGEILRGIPSTAFLKFSIKDFGAGSLGNKLSLDKLSFV